MDKKTLLAAAAHKLTLQPSSSPSASSSPTALLEPPAAAPARARIEPAPGDSPPPPPTRAAIVKARPVVSKGITLRPSNLEKLDALELSLRKQGIKASHSGLIQIAIDRLEDGAPLAAAYRELLKLDLRLK
jgi:hypothetical protein